MVAGIRFGLTCAALVAALCACQRNPGGQAPDTPPDTAMVNASAALIEPSAASSTMPGEACPIGIAQNMIGQPDLPALRDALARSVAPHPLRWVRPGVPVTQDYVADRLNVIVGDTGRIEALRCG